jgi:hypothetical protein
MSGNGTKKLSLNALCTKGCAVSACGSRCGGTILQAGGIIVASFKRDGLVQRKEMGIKPLSHRFPVIVFGRNVPFAEIACVFGCLYMDDSRAVSECVLDGMPFFTINVSNCLVKHGVSGECDQCDIPTGLQVIVLGAQELGVNVRMMVIEIARYEFQVSSRIFRTSYQNSN